MCAIIGALVRHLHGTTNKTISILSYIADRSTERGRDGFGFSARSAYSNGGYYDIRSTSCYNQPVFRQLVEDEPLVLVGNFRAEPTTEYVKMKELSDQQPYRAGNWTIAHNGTIANDADLRTHVVPTTIDSAAIAEHLDRLERDEPALPIFLTFSKAVNDLKGSFAILAYHKDSHCIFFATNYRPIWYIETPDGVFFASKRDYFPKEYSPRMVPPYSVGRCGVTTDYKLVYHPLGKIEAEKPKKALVVCSGGLDSVVAATKAKADGMEIHLLNFQYGSRAEQPEIEAIKKVAEALQCGYTLFPLPVYKPSDSPLLNPDAAVAGGEAGAEFAHEWVPARNLLLLAVATAYAEANGYEIIVLGNNLEEAGAYPDNEPEFVDKFNDILPFAVGDGKRVRVIMPVGNLMKHEIVALGHELGAPMQHTWSCYRAGKQHCGQCGPCFMRRTAFKINNLPEVIRYADEE